jgi:hypothetical protein
MIERLETLAGLINARIGVPDGDGHFILITGGDISDKKLSGNGNNISEMAFEFISAGRYQNPLLSAHTEAGELMLGSNLDVKPVTLPHIMETAAGFICQSEWRMLWRNS